MMASTSSLLEKYSREEKSARTLVSTSGPLVTCTPGKPEWERYGVSQSSANLLRLLCPEESAVKTKEIIQCNLTIMQACLDACGVQEPKSARWVLSFFYELLREDSSCYNLFDLALKQKMLIFKTLIDLLDSEDDQVCDTSAWLLSAIIGHSPSYFSEADVGCLVEKVLATTTLGGALDAIVNLMKSDKFRKFVFSCDGVVDKIFFVNVTTAPAPVLYKSVFAVWLLSFDPSLVEETSEYRVIKKIRDILTARRIEKVVRICITALRNLMTHKASCEDMVELGLLDVVQSLEFEKWRDAELYDDIRDLSSQISNQVAEMSNFDKYEKELSSGRLIWSPVHTTKFWGENVFRFDQNDFRALKTLAALLLSDDTDPTTLAVACHDVGEFVALHPLGKKKVAQLGIKDRIMELMGSAGDDKKDVRREALLCCQKIMLNKWQDVAVTDTKKS